MKRINEHAMKELKITSNYSLVDGRFLCYRNGSKQRSHELLRMRETTILRLRKEGVPCFVFKDENEFWGCVLSKGESYGRILSTAKEHLCSFCGNCSSRKQEDGGCGKISDWFLIAYQNSKMDFNDALLMSKRIEKYDFIRQGYEMINTPSEVFDVIECDNFRSLSKIDDE